METTSKKKQKNYLLFVFPQRIRFIVFFLNHGIIRAIVTPFFYSKQGQKLDEA
jgi:hypothetical protein